MNNVVKKRFDILIATSGQSITQSFELDKTITSIRGLLITSDYDQLLYYCGAQKIEINREEFFPENYESKLLMSGINVPPSQRYFNLGNIAPGNGIIKITYTDTPTTQAFFSPYRVSFYFDCITSIPE